MIQVTRKERRRFAKRMAKAANVFKKNARRAWRLVQHRARKTPHEIPAAVLVLHGEPHQM